MEKIMEEYGGVIITAGVIAAFVTLMLVWIGTDEKSVVYQAFNNVFTYLFNNTGLTS